jgi:lysophospholipase L1-like esterase
MDWSGSSVEFRLKGTFAQIEISADHQGRDQWFVFEIDGKPSARFRPAGGTAWYTIFDSRSPDRQADLANAVRHIRVIKDTQASYSEQGGTACCLRLRYDGELLPLPARKKIEFIGDSITSGEGVLSPAMSEIGSDVSIDEWCSFYYAWNGFTARALDADWQVVSQGGWGVHCGWDNNILTNIPSIYNQVCGIIRPPFAEARGADSTYDFSFDPDVVLINLGTNDNSGFRQPAWKHPVTGELHKLRRTGGNPDIPDYAFYNEEDVAVITDAAVAFVRNVAEKNPRAKILWVFGMMGQALWPALEKARDILRGSGLDRFDTLLLPDTPRSEWGANEHPLSVAHERVAKIIADRIRPNLE